MADTKEGADFKSAPSLSVIIPTLNEAAVLPLLLGDLAVQSGVALEVLVSDGGSTDGTPEVAAAELERLSLPGTVLRGPRGRGRQLNLGASNARGEWLLFLHADSRLPCVTALADALKQLRCEKNFRIAGHFTLCFERTAGVDGFALHWCEIKAASGLPGTIHGDQGFLLHSIFFRELGGFREDLPVLEDTLLAEQVRHLGNWRLLPAVIVTSPRRFHAEGFRQRQTLNALLMNFAAIGWDEPLHRLPAPYPSQDQVRPLDLALVYRQIDTLLREQPWCARLRIWYRTGEYVRSNAWQLVLWRAVRRAWSSDTPLRYPAGHSVGKFLRWFEPLTAHSPGKLLATLLTCLWFYSQSRRDPVI